MKRLFTALAPMSAATTPATSETPRVANPRAGREVADKICAACHVVASDQKQAPVRSRLPRPSNRSRAGQRATIGRCGPSSPPRTVASAIPTPCPIRSCPMIRFAT